MSIVNEITDKKTNMLINSDFNFWQRGTTSTTNAHRYLADRWVARADSFQSFTYQRILTPTEPALQLTSDVSFATGLLEICQQIEYEIFKPFLGKTVTLSMIGRALNSNVLSTDCALVAYFQNTFKDNPGIFGGGATFETGSRKVLTTSLAQYSYTFTLPADTLSMVVSLGTVSNFGAGGTHACSIGDGMVFSKVWMTEGAQASNFETCRRTIDNELDLCKRYYEKSFPLDTAPASNTGNLGNVMVGTIYAAGANYYALPVRFSVQKRAAPVVTIYNPQAANFQIRNFNRNADFTNSGAVSIGDSSFSLNGSSPGASAIGETIYAYWTANAEF
jgi:hypothetical protein